MLRFLTALFFMTSLVFFGCSSEDDPNAPPGGGTPINAQATYRITFTPNFTAETHPTDYPDNATFGPLVVVAHGTQIVLFREGLAVSSGFETYVEEGTTGDLQTELASVGDSQLPTVEFGSAIPANGTRFVDIIVKPTTTRISFAAKLSPSPDWFLGVDSFNLVNPDNSLVDEFELTLSAYDAGTDAGITYESADEEENETVALVSGDPFVNPATNGISRFGTLLIERIDDGDP